MPVEKVTQAMLSANHTEFNIATLVPYAVPAMRLMMERHIKHYESHFQQDNDGRSPDYDLINLQWPLQWAAVATQLPDFLRELYPTIYGESGPVEIGTVHDFQLLENDHEGGGANAALSTAGNMLYRQAKRLGVTHVFDGQGFTFFERGEPTQWILAMALRDMQFKLSHGLEYPALKFMHRFKDSVNELIIFGDADLSPSWRDHL